MTRFLAIFFRAPKGRGSACTSSHRRRVACDSYSGGFWLLVMAITGVISTLDVMAQDQVAVYFPNVWNCFNLAEIDIAQTTDDGIIQVASSTPYFAQIGEMPLPTGLKSGHNLISAIAYYANSTGFIAGSMEFQTNITAKGIEILGTNGCAFASSADLIHWQTNSAQSPFIVPMTNAAGFFKALPGSMSLTFSDTPLEVQYLAYQDTNVVSAPPPNLNPNAR